MKSTDTNLNATDLNGSGNIWRADATTIAFDDGSEPSYTLNGNTLVMTFDDVDDEGINMTLTWRK